MPRVVGIVVIIVVVGSPTGGIRASRRKRAATSRGALKAGRPRLRVAARARARGEFRRTACRHLSPTFTLWKSIDMAGTIQWRLFEHQSGQRSTIPSDAIQRTQTLARATASRRAASRLHTARCVRVANTRHARAQKHISLRRWQTVPVGRPPKEKRIRANYGSTDSRARDDEGR